MNKLDYDTCKKLEEAGYPHGDSGNCFGTYEHSLTGEVQLYEECNEFTTCIEYDRYIYIPNLSELIGACDKVSFELVVYKKEYWVETEDASPVTKYDTPEEAVANLFLHLNQNVDDK